MLRIEPLILDDQSRALYDRFVPANHPLRQMDEALDFSFVLPLVADRYNSWIGRPAEHPERMWRLLFAQYYLNLSDEKICLDAHDRLALRLFLRLGADEKPPHPTTLQKFRFNRLKEETYLQGHFTLLRQGQVQGVLDPSERQLWDSSHMRSNTRVVSIPYLLLQARNKVIKQVKTIDAAFAAELEQQAKADKAAYRAEREKQRKEGKPKPTKEEKATAAAEVVSKTLVAVRERIAARQLETTERLNVWLAVLEKVIHDREKGATDRIVSVHDLEARKGRKSSVVWDGRKMAVAMQENSYLVTAAVVEAGNVNDCQLVEPTLDQLEDGLNLVPPELTADKGADTGPVWEMLDKRGIQSHIPVSATNNSQGGDLFTVEDFTYYPQLRMLKCPAGEITRTIKRDKAQTRDGWTFSFPRETCRTCTLRPQCQGADRVRVTGRSVYIGQYWLQNRAAEEHVKTAAFEEAYRKRGRIEAKIAELVYHGARRCRYRGDERSQVQLLLTVMVVNGKRLARLLARQRAESILEAA